MSYRSACPRPRSRPSLWDLPLGLGSDLRLAGEVKRQRGDEISTSQVPQSVVNPLFGHLVIALEKCPWIIAVCLLSGAKISVEKWRHPVNMSRRISRIAATCRAIAWSAERVAMSATIDPDTQSATNKNGEASFASRKLSSQVDRGGFWRDCAPKTVIGEHGWTVWSQHLTNRRNVQSVDELCNAKGTALSWGINLSQLPSPTFELLQLLAQANRNKLPHRVAVVEAL